MTESGSDVTARATPWGRALAPHRLRRVQRSTCGRGRRLRPRWLARHCARTGRLITRPTPSLKHLLLPKPARHKRPLVRAGGVPAVPGPGGLGRHLPPVRLPHPAAECPQPSTVRPPVATTFPAHGRIGSGPLPPTEIGRAHV